MVSEARSLSHQSADSVLEALILEANLIKRHQPPYNVSEKDNTSFNYLVITKEDFSRVLVVRGRELFRDWKQGDIKCFFGPFPQGGSLQEAVKIVRKIFPFRDTCTPCSDSPIKDRSRFGKSKRGRSLIEGNCKPCFNRQIGLCPGVCSGEITKEEYARTIRNIRELVSGNFKGLKRQLAREMKAAVVGERFEEAQVLRRQIAALEHIRDVSLIRGDRISSGGPSIGIASGVRIEAFDVAHTSGTETVAVMTVVRDGEADKSAYRKFKIRSATNDDVASLKEALSRRLAHPEWPLPRVFVVDGGRSQMNAAKNILRQAGIEVPLVGVVKNEFHKPERLIGDSHAIETHERDILLANAEAHRFAIVWHRARRRAGLLR
jgi:excinuclease ABC subunit C